MRVTSLTSTFLARPEQQNQLRSRHGRCSAIPSSNPMSPSPIGINSFQPASCFHDQRVDRDSLADAELLAACGDALRHAGELPEAKARLQEALAIQRRRLDPTN